MKTIKEWFGQLPNDISEKAMRNTSQASLAHEEPSLELALCDAFRWSKSPEGHEFWASVANEIESENQ